MTDDSHNSKRRWGAEQRLEFIEFRAYWEGGVNRSDITERFGVSVPQASADLGSYRELAPGNLAYDSSAKRYVAADDFTPRFLDPSPDRYLAQLRALAEGVLDQSDTWLGALPEACAMPVPYRRVDAGLFRTLLGVMRAGRSVEVLYQSLNPRKPEAAWRRITPHAFGSDGLRWHVRGFCHIDSSFKDFILPRWREMRAIGDPGASGAQDRDWVETFAVKLAPNPSLSAGQKKAVAWEFDMPAGGLTLPVQIAMLYYLKRSLRLDDTSESPSEAPVVVANRDAFEEALASAEGRLIDRAG